MSRSSKITILLLVVLGCGLLRDAVLADPWMAQQTRKPSRRPAGPSVVRPPVEKDPKAAKLSRGLREVQNLMRGGNYAEALARLDLIEGEGKGVEEYLLLRGTCLRGLGRFGEAIDLYRAEADRLVAEQQDPTTMLIELERALREGKDPGRAFAVCLELHRGGGGTSLWVRDEMESLIQADGLGDASLGPLREEIARRPEAVDLRDLYVGALFFLGRYEESLQETIALDQSRNARGRVLLDHLRMVSKKRVPESALAVADASIAAGLEGDDLQEALFLRGTALRSLRRFPEAVGAYEQAARASKDGPLSRVAQRERADLLVRDLRDYQAGEKACGDLIADLRQLPSREQGPLLSQALVALADCRLRMGQYEQASDVLREVEEHEADPAGKEEAAFQQAEILFYGGSVERATEGYERVVKEFRGGGHVNDALERLLLLRRVADAGSVSVAALGQIAYHRRVGSAERALEIAVEGARLCGDCTAAEDFVTEESRALLELDRIEEAAESADSLAARFPESGVAPTVLRTVADRMRERLGETEAVLRRYEDLIIRFPKSHEAIEVRVLLRQLRKEGEDTEKSSSEVVG